MKIALIGASGFVGKALLKELESRGHKVTAIARNPDNIEANTTTKVVQADVTDEAALADSLKGNDAVVSAYNAGWTNPNIYEDFLKGSKAIQHAVKKSGVNRFFFIGGGGSLYVAPDTQLVDTPQFPAEWKQGALAARDYLNVLKEEKDLDWTFLSPSIEMHQGTSGTRKGEYRTGLDNPVFNDEGRSVISVEDMSIAVVDELENPKHIRQRFTVGY